MAIRTWPGNVLGAAGVRPPVGLYRTDSLIGAILLFRLDPSSHQWDRHRTVVDPEAAWKSRHPLEAEHL